MKTVFTFIFLFLFHLTSATIHQVGSTQTYISPNQLYQANVVEAGDTIDIDAEDYFGMTALAVWNKDNLLIRGVGGMPHLIADGEYIFGKGIWVLSGNNITVEKIEFSGATVPDQNGAGVRLDGSGLTVRQCYFHDNENGILTNNTNEGIVLVEFSEFSNNGFGDGQSHNIYVGRIEKLIFQFNYSHHADIGHNLKSRATKNYILYNRIMDEETGTSSRLVDLPNGGFSLLMGNIMMQGENAPNMNMVGYGLEGLSNADPHEFYFINNTLLSDRSNALFLDIADGTSISNISNNIFAGVGNLNMGPITMNNNNWLEPNTSLLNFVDKPNFDYHLTNSSPVVDMGMILSEVNGISLTPEASYLHPTYFEIRTPSNNMIDIGAYEFVHPVGLNNIKPETLIVYPNPFSQEINLKYKEEFIKEICLFDSFGELIFYQTQSNSLDLSQLPVGIYFLKMRNNLEETFVVRVVKE